MTDPRTVSTTVAGEPCRVTSPLLRQDEMAVYVIAADATLTAQAKDGRTHWFIVKCDSRAQSEHVEREMAKRPDLSEVSREKGDLWSSGENIHVVPFRLLGRRWLADWRETADRIEVREGASGSVYMTAIVDGAVVAEKRVPFSCACDVAADIARLRAAHPSLALFDFRPMRGEG